MFAITGFACMLWLIPWMLTAKDDLPRADGVVKKKAAAIPFGRILASPLIWGHTRGQLEGPAPLGRHGRNSTNPTTNAGRAIWHRHPDRKYWQRRTEQPDFA